MLFCLIMKNQSKTHSNTQFDPFSGSQIEKLDSNASLKEKYA